MLCIQVSSLKDGQLIRVARLSPPGFRHLGIGAVSGERVTPHLVSRQTASLRSLVFHPRFTSSSSIMASSYLISTAVSQVSYTQADIDGIIKSARHTLVESDSAPGEISHLVVCKQGSPDWKKSQEIWLRTNLQLLPGYPSSFVMAPTEEQIFYPVFCDRKFAGRYVHQFSGGS